MISAKLTLDNLVKVSDSFTINMYSNGYMVEVSGQDKISEWKTVKIVATTDQELLDLISQVTRTSRVD
jgi:hypothetical protein